MKTQNLLRAAALVLPMSLTVCVVGCKKEETSAQQPAQNPAPAGTPNKPATPSAAAATQQFTWKDITFSYPKTWKAADRADAGGAEIVGPSDDSWEPNIFLKIHPNAENESAGEILVEGMSQLAAAKPSFSQGNKQFPLKLPNGTEYARLSFKSKDETGRIDLTQWYLVIPLPEKRWLEVRASAADEAWDRQQPVFEQIINSMQFKK